MAGEGETLEIVPSSASKNTFPMTLRVLVVDGDPICLRNIEILLTRIQYQVVTVMEARSAIRLLRERQCEFDMIMTDIHMPQMNGFQLLNIVKREFKIPVIMMSTDDKVKIISRGLTRGACLYLLKPIQINDIRNLWQHVARWRREQKIKLGLGVERNNVHLQTVVVNTEGTPYANEDNSSGRKSNVPKSNEENGEAGTSKEKMITKKPRMAWIPNLHAKFLQAINILGINRAIPREILSLMNLNGLTREHVASHLQKYRVFIKGLTELKEKGELPSRTRLNNECINLGPPSLTYNLPQGNPQYLVQQQAQWQPCQSTGFGGYTASSSKQPVAPRYFNQEASNVDAFAQVGQSFPMTSQGNLQPPLLGNATAFSQQNLVNDPVSGMQQNGTRINDNLVNGSNLLQIIHQKSQVTQGLLGNGMLDLNLQGQNTLPSIGSIGSAACLGVYGTWKQAMANNPNNNNHTGGLTAMNQMLTGTASFDSQYANGSLVQPVTAAPPPPPPSVAQAEEQMEIGDDTWADLLRSTSNGEFNFLFEQDNQSPNQQLDGDAMMDFLFDINEFQTDGDNNPAS